MRRLLLAAALMVPLLLATQAAASTRTSVTMTFTEPDAVPFVAGCPVAPEGFCGSGQVIPLGSATETIEFGAGCGGTCDLRTINLANGSLFLEETFSNPLCPAGCARAPVTPVHATLTDTVIGGSGAFVGATGSLRGTVFATRDQSVVKLTGTITFGP